MKRRFEYLLSTRHTSVQAWRKHEAVSQHRLKHKDRVNQRCHSVTRLAQNGQLALADGIAMSTASRGSGWSELPGNSFVAA